MEGLEKQGLSVGNSVPCLRPSVPHALSKGPRQPQCSPGRWQVGPRKPLRPETFPCLLPHAASAQGECTGSFYVEGISKLFIVKDTQQHVNHFLTDLLHSCLETAGRKRGRETSVCEGDTDLIGCLLHTPPAEDLARNPGVFGTSSGRIRLPNIQAWFLVAQR